MRSRQDIKIYVENLYLVESPTYHDLPMRPYVTQIEGSLIDRIEERYSKARRFTAPMLADIASQFLVPDNRTRGVIEIPNGWGSRRGRFVLTLDIQIGTGDRLKQMVVGYTNSVGFTTRNVDPDMEFYVNNTFMLSQRRVRTDHGYRMMYVPTEINDVVSDRENAGLRRRNDEVYTMRPEDVFSTIDAGQSLDHVEELTDLRTTLNKNAIKSSIGNRISSRFMSSVLSSRQKAIENTDYGSSVLDINGSAQGYAMDAYATDDVFLRAISNIRGLTTTVDNFTYRDLLKIDPEADDRTTPNLLDDNSLSTSRHEQETTRLDGQEEEDRVAAIIAMGVPALMIESGLMSLRFQAHNQDADERYTFIPTKATSFIQDTSLEPFVDKFRERFIDEVVHPLTGGDRYDIGLDVHVRAFGDIDFTMYWDGADRGRYVLPCFCSSLASPILTSDRRDVRTMAKRFDELFDQFLPNSLAGGGYNNGRDFNY